MLWDIKLSPKAINGDVADKIGMWKGWGGSQRLTLQSISRQRSQVNCNLGSQMTLIRVRVQRGRHQSLASANPSPTHRHHVGSFKRAWLEKK